MTTNTATIWSFSSHCSFTERPIRSPCAVTSHPGTGCSTRGRAVTSHPGTGSSPRGRGGLTSPLPEPPPAPCGALVPAVPHPERGAPPPRWVRPSGGEVFSGAFFFTAGEEEEEEEEEEEGAARLGAAGGVSSQSSSRARSMVPEESVPAPRCSVRGSHPQEEPLRVVMTAHAQGCQIGPDFPLPIWQPCIHFRSRGLLHN